jgi:hypothetical protein
MVASGHVYTPHTIGSVIMNFVFSSPEQRKLDEIRQACAKAQEQNCLALWEKRWQSAVTQNNSELVRQLEAEKHALVF